MSPVFRHGRLRLYLLKLLDESPRHGYEVIRLLQDRFMGVYAPSPGTIYPRLARLEEEGLVTHDEADGRKVYRITDKGRAELNARHGDLIELEEEITASVRDIAREVTEDVRETVRTLREELTWAAREFHTRAREQPSGAAQSPAEGAAQSPADSAAQSPAESARQAREEAHGERARARDEAHRERDRAWDEAHRQRDEAYRERDRARAEAHRERDRARAEARGEWDAATRDQDDDERDQQHEHAGRWGHREWGDWASWSGWGGGPGARGPHGCADPHAYRDLERLARQFSRDLRSAAWQAQAMSEDAVRDLRGILDETIDRIKAEVFKGSHQPDDPAAPPGDDPGK
jgi:DNA-binding PadR family transcriptional regulator